MFQIESGPEFAAINTDVAKTETSQDFEVEHLDEIIQPIKIEKSKIESPAPITEVVEKQEFAPKIEEKENPNEISRQSIFVQEILHEQYREELQDESQ